MTGSDVTAVRGAWEAYRGADDVAALLERQMTRDVGSLRAGAEDSAAALRVAQDVTDLRLRYEDVDVVDRDRFALWARQLGIDAAAGDEGAVAGDVSSLELVWERLGGEGSEVAGLAGDLKTARDAADRQDMEAAEKAAAQLEADITRV